MEKTNFYCHATTLDNLESIIKDGIKANEFGEIYLYDDCIMGYPASLGLPLVDYHWRIGEKEVFYVGDHIARNQIFIPGDMYVNFFIPAENITGELEREDVCEIPAKAGHQWIARQDVIYPEAFQIRMIGRQNNMMFPLYSFIDFK